MTTCTGTISSCYNYVHTLHDRVSRSTGKIHRETPPPSLQVHGKFLLLQQTIVPFNIQCFVTGIILGYMVVVIIAVY